MDKILFYIFGALFTSGLLQYLVIDLSHKRGIFIDDHEADLPQKFHNSPTPRIGGLGIFIGCFFMMTNAEVGLYIMLSSVPAFMAGFLEDLYAKISPGRRLIIMVVSAVMSIYLLDVVVTDYGFFQVPVTIGVVITIVAIIGLINGANLVDGINGLSSGISIIILLTYYFMSTRMLDTDLQFITIISAVSILGFLIFNYPKGRIFLGDGGAYFTGFILAIISILIAIRHEEISPWFILVCLIHPVWEVMFSFFRKATIVRISPFKPDPHHLHQLIYLYITHKNNPITALVILPFVLITNVLAIYFYKNDTLLFIIALTYAGIYTLAYYLLWEKHKKVRLVGNENQNDSKKQTSSIYKNPIKTKAN